MEMQHKLPSAAPCIEFVTFFPVALFFFSISVSPSVLLFPTFSSSFSLEHPTFFFIEKSNATLHVTCFRSRDKFLYEPPRPWPPLTPSSTFDYVDIPRGIKIHVREERRAFNSVGRNGIKWISLESAI